MFQCIIKEVKFKIKKNSDYLGENISGLFHFLVLFVFATSETELDSYHQKENVGVVSQVAE